MITTKEENKEEKKEKKKEEKKEGDWGLFQRVRGGVLELVEEIAVISSHKNEDECRKLLEVMEGNATDLGVCLPLARCLGSILGRNPQGLIYTFILFKLCLCIKSFYHSLSFMSY